MTSAPCVLVLRALGLGDLITGLPALQMLRAALPEHQIVLATTRRWAPIVARAGTVDDVLDAAELAPLQDAPRHADLAIDLHGNGPASREVLERCEPQRLLAFAGGPVRWRREEHEVARWCRLLREGLPAIGQPGLDEVALRQPCPDVAGILGAPPDGAPPDEAAAPPHGAPPDGAPPDEAAALPHGATVLHCGAAASSRRWPPVRFAAVAMLLAGEGHEVVVTGGPGEEHIAEQIAAAARVRSETALSVEYLLELVGNARLVICGDTGVAHLATAYAVPSVTLFGPVSPLRWGPPVHPRHQVIWHGDDTGDPHGAELDQALAAIAVGEVLAAAHAASPQNRYAGHGRG